MAEVNIDKEPSINVSLKEENNITSNVVKGATLNASVPDINYIPGYVEAESERRANEVVRQSNETDRIALYDDMVSKVSSGYFNGTDGEDGFSPIANVSKSGNTATISITDKNGTTSATVSDGTNGTNGTNGTDGFSPTITSSKSGKTTTLTITDINGTTTATILDGEDGHGSGDMLKSVYDTDNDGIVDNAEKVNNHTVESDVPSNAVFTDTTYSKLSEFTNDSGYVTNTDYANDTTGGVFKTSSALLTNVTSDGRLYSPTDTYANYSGRSNSAFISKGTLENVITGKDLTTKSYVDGSVEPINDYVFGEESVSGEGTSIQMTDTLKGKFKSVECKGQTSQTGTPTPSSPIPVNVVSGDNEINICGKNLCNNINLNLALVYTNETIITDATSRTMYAKVPKNTDITITKTDITNRFRVGLLNKIPEANDTFHIVYQRDNSNILTTTINTGEYEYVVVQYTNQSETSNIMINVGTTAIPYEPYIGNTYPVYLGVKNAATSYKTSGTGYFTYNIDNSKIKKTMTLSFMPSLSLSTATIYLATTTGGTSYNLGNITPITSGTKAKLTFTLTDAQLSAIKATSGGYIQIYRDNAQITQSSFSEVWLEENTNVSHPSSTPIELCKIGDYQDYIYKTDKWYLHKEIGKVVLDGSENDWGFSSNGNVFYIGQWAQNNNAWYSNNNNDLSGSICNYFVNVARNNMINVESGFGISNTGAFNIKHPDFTSGVVADFKAWLREHQVIAYYRLATPTDTEITDTTLLEQLEALSSEKGITNISQTNNDLPMILDLEAFKNNLNGKLGLLDKLVEE